MNEVTSVVSSVEVPMAATVSTKRKAMYIFFTLFSLMAIGYGGYVYYEYEKFKRINATVVTPAQARDIIKRNAVL